MNPKKYVLNILEISVRKHLLDRKFYHGVPKCSGRKICYEFFIQISEHFRALVSRLL